MARKFIAELLGTAVLVYFGCGVATLMFGFGFAGGSLAAGVVATALAFGLVLAGLCYAFGSISGCHVNPAVTLGMLVAGRIEAAEAAGYWVAQFVGAMLGALALWGTFSGSPTYSRAQTGLGADGYGTLSHIGINLAGAFVIEVILTAVFVFIVISVTERGAPAAVAGLVIGLALMLAHVMGILVTGTSVNPARSLAPALIVGGTALHQVWLFIVAPLVGGALAAAVHRVLRAEAPASAPADAAV